MASVKEYQERNVAISAEIESLQAKNASLTASISSYNTAAQDWRNQKGNDGKGGCKGTAKQKAACQEDMAYKESKAVGYEGQAKAATQAIASNNAKITQLSAEFQKNIELIASAQKSSEQVAKELSLQGTTTEAVQTKSNAESEALLLAAKASSDAQAEAVKMEAEANASNKKKIGMVIAIVVGGVALVGALILVKKLRKKKK